MIQTTSRLLSLFLLSSLLSCGGSQSPVGLVFPSAIGEPTPPQLGDLSQGQALQGFRMDALYLNHRESAVGARFVHIDTGFVLDLLNIESVPQAFVWVGSIPDSDRGEPHTQEHLLLGKGNVGRSVASLESMTLADSSAFTQRVRTAYHLHTVAGMDVFLEVLEARLDSLLHPDYTDEEIRREVHNYSVTVDSTDGLLALEEGGTVYNEMVSAFERSGYRMWMAFCKTLYGPEHPLALSSGGLPEGIREMTPEHIRTFHAGHYWLGNMGMVGAFSATHQVSDLLGRLDAMLDRLEPVPVRPEQEIITIDTLPEPTPHPSTAIQFVEYPSQESEEAVDIELAWPPTRALSTSDELLLYLFLLNLASDANSDLHARFVDSELREIELDVSGVGAGYLEWPGRPVYVTLSGAPSSQVTEDVVADIRERVRAELVRIAELEPGSDELADFNRRLRSRLVAEQRELRDFVDSPPGFGIRGTGAQWIEHLTFLEGAGFHRSLTLRPEQAQVEAILDAPGNPWAERLAAWGLLDTEPYVFVSQPSPELHARQQEERQQRLDDKVAELVAQFGVDSEQEAIARYQAAHDATSAELEAIAAQVEVPPLIDSLPMTQDDTLVFQERELGGVSAVVSVFDNMSGATVGLALDLSQAGDRDLVYLSLLPALVRRVGISDDLGDVAYPALVEALQNEILSLAVGYSVDPITERVELDLSVSGTTPEEAAVGLEWLRRVLYGADWRVENLPRLRDVINERLDGLRRMTQRSEEAWVNDPATAYRYQHNRHLLATSSFMTRTHNVLRLRWIFAEASPEAATQAGGYLRALGESASSCQSRDDINALLELMGGETGLSEEAEALAHAAIDDIRLTLGDLPDGSIASDVHYLSDRIARDLEYPAEQALDELTNLRDSLLLRSRARLYAIGASQSIAELAPAVEALVAGLSPGPTSQPSNSADPVVLTRLRQRLGDDVAPVFVGLVNPDTHGGVHLNSSPAANYLSYDREGLLDFLTGRMYGGGGAHSLFMKTWGAGLAYSNGVRADARSGTLRYYAERCPELQQTMAFVIEQLQAVESDPELADYAFSQVFESRSSRRYELRGAAMARDLVDGRSPAQVTAFREAMIALRAEPNLSGELYARMADVYGRIMPGYGPASADVEGGVFFVIGPADQLDGYESYLQSVEGPDVRLYRLFPRDFWLE